MSILTLVVLAVSIVVLLKVGSLLFDPPAYKQFTLAELEREMTRITDEWSQAMAAHEPSKKP